MDFWTKMLAGIAGVFYRNDLDEDILMKQMNVALQERHTILDGQSDFIDPCVGREFKDKWGSAYRTGSPKSIHLIYGNLYADS